jgi:hypothetical protein
VLAVQPGASCLRIVLQKSSAGRVQHTLQGHLMRQSISIMSLLQQRFNPVETL